MGRLAIRPILVLQSFPKKVEKNENIQLSCRVFDKKLIQPLKVSKLYMMITSLKDGHSVWDLSVVRKNTSGFDIGIGTLEMKEGHSYLVRVSNNRNLSPSASTIFKVKESTIPIIALLPIILSPLFIRKYGDKGITNLDGLIQHLKEQGFTDKKIDAEVKRIIKEITSNREVKIPLDITRKVISKQWITQLDHRVCETCRTNSISGKNSDGVWDYDNPNSPKIPAHYNCRCTYELIYENWREDEFRSAALMSQFKNMEQTIHAINVIKEIKVRYP